MTMAVKGTRGSSTGSSPRRAVTRRDHGFEVEILRQTRCSRFGKYHERTSGLGKRLLGLESIRASDVAVLGGLYESTSGRCI